MTDIFIIYNCCGKERTVHDGRGISLVRRLCKECYKEMVGSVCLGNNDGTGRAKIGEIVSGEFVQEGRL